MNGAAPHSIFRREISKRSTSLLRTDELDQLWTLPTTHLRSALFSAVGAVHDAFISRTLHTVVVTAATTTAAMSIYAPKYCCSACLARCAVLCVMLWLVAVRCGIFMRIRMIPWHDLGSSPGRAICPAGLLHPLFVVVPLQVLSHCQPWVLCTALSKPAVCCGACSWCLPCLTLTLVCANPPL